MTKEEIDAAWEATCGVRAVFDDRPRKCDTIDCQNLVRVPACALCDYCAALAMGLPWDDSEGWSL